MTRQTKTPRQRAEETLGVAQRRVDRLTAAVEHQRAVLQVYETELDEAKARLDYARRDPALDPKQLDNPHTPTGDTA